MKSAPHTTIEGPGSDTMKVQDFLNQRHADYDVVVHPAAYDAQRMAQSVHVTGERVAKTVLLRADKGFKYVMAVLPATHHVDLLRVKQVIGAGDLELASEEEVAAHCPDCEVGAMPPFGSRICVETLIDECLARGRDRLRGRYPYRGHPHEVPGLLRIGASAGGENLAPRVSGLLLVAVVRRRAATSDRRRTSRTFIRRTNVRPSPTTAKESKSWLPL